MSKIDEKVSEPLKIMLPNGMQKPGRIYQSVYSVHNDDDALELLDIFNKGTEINCVVGNYIFLKRFEELKVEL